METNSPTFYVYMLKCADGTFYIGQTNNLEKRLRAHNGTLKGGAKYTKYRSPVTIVYSEKSISKSAALRRELALKKLTRKQKESLINSVSK